MMGGYGSGRWGWRRTKGTTDPVLRLDLRYLARRGLIAPGVVGSLLVAWSRGDQPAGDVLVRYVVGRPGKVVLEYRVRRHDGGAWEPVREPVALERTPCPFGGSRPWFLCPGCRNRRAVLYGADGRFRCSACHGLAYSSTREGPCERNRRRAAGLRRRLGYTPGAFSVPSKPPGMHRRTYERIVAEIDGREQAALVAFLAATGAMSARLEARFHQPNPGGIALIQNSCTVA